MKKLVLSALAFLVMTASALMLRSGNAQPLGVAPELATNAAYRDGLYLGRLAAVQGSDPHVSAGRWVKAKDRAAFSAGYGQAYYAQIASRNTENGVGPQ